MKQRLTIAEAARRLKLTPARLYQCIALDELHARRDKHNRYIINREDLLKFDEARKNRAIREQERTLEREHVRLLKRQASKRKDEERQQLRAEKLEREDEWRDAILSELRGIRRALERKGQ